MKELKRILLLMLVAATVAGCAFAQKNGNDNRPPKEQPRIIEKPKEPKAPPSNSNNNSSNSNRKRP